MTHLTRRARSLEAHGISYKILDGKIYAEDTYMQNGKLGIRHIDVTNWTTKKLLFWIGY